MELKDLEGLDTQSPNGASPDHISESNYLVFEFEKNLSQLMLDLPRGKSSSTSDQPKCTRRGGRPKKPPSWFDEETEPPKSSKKKASRGDALECTSLRKHLSLFRISPMCKLLIIVVHVVLIFLSL